MQAYHIKTALVIAVMAGTAMLAGTLTAAQPDAAQATIDSLLRSLDNLGQEIAALPEGERPLLTTKMQLVGTDAYEGYLNSSFGTTNTGEPPKDMALSIRPRGVAGTFVGMMGLTAPFFWKGGEFPGIGGTCTARLATDCTVVLSFVPSKQDSNGTSAGGLTRYRTMLHFEYLPDAEAITAYSNVLVVDGYLSAEEIATASASDLAVNVSLPAASVFPGEQSPLQLLVGPQDKVYFANVRISGIQPPFFLQEDRCATPPIQISSCTIELSFAPARAGTFTNAVTVTLDDGIATHQFPVIALTGTALTAPRDLNPEKHLLVVYNDAWAESVEAKNYYLARRPEFASANALGVHFPIAPACPSLLCLSNALEVVTYAEMRARIVAPVLSWLRTHPEKNIQYIVLMRGLPTRTSGLDTPTVPYNGDDPRFSTQDFLREEAARLLSREVFPSSLDMGSLDATKRYIDKLAATYAAASSKTSLISGNGAGTIGSTYYFSDVQRYTADYGLGRARASALKTARPNARISYRRYGDAPFTTAANVAGFFSWGVYEYGNRLTNGTFSNGDYAINDTVHFTGNSGWYLIQTVESFNGLWGASGWQGNFIKWFSANAFGGEKYRNTPAAAVTHVIEPFTSGINAPSLFPCWDSGRPFAFCAWRSSNRVDTLQAVGDPWVTR